MWLRVARLATTPLNARPRGVVAYQSSSGSRLMSSAIALEAEVLERHRRQRCPPRRVSVQFLRAVITFDGAYNSRGILPPPLGQVLNGVCRPCGPQRRPGMD